MADSTGLRGVEWVRLPEPARKQYHIDSDDTDPAALGPLSGVNLFVGANNSGKSRLLRSLALHPSWEVTARGLALTRRRSAIASALGEFRNLLVEQALAGWGAVAVDELTFEPPRWTRLDGEHVSEFRPLADKLGGDNPKGAFRTVAQPAQVGKRHARTSQLEAARSECFIKVRDAIADVPAPILGSSLREQGNRYPKFFYVPVLRSLRRLGGGGDPLQDFPDPYFERTHTDYWHGSGGAAPATRTGAALFAEVRDRLLGRRPERDQVRRYEQFLSRAFFEGQEVSITPSRHSASLEVMVGPDEYPIQHVGDGLQSIIILTFDSFFHTEEASVFFIEEPELFLHPSTQRRLLEFFLRQENHLFFITTHSNHLLDLSADYTELSVFTFEKSRAQAGGDDSPPVFRVRQVDRGDDSSLRLLGVRCSSVLLVNATIFVEGITDRLYLRAMLALLMRERQRNYHEDVHYAFVEYGGSSGSHWSFMTDADNPIIVERLCGRAIVVTDRDDPGDAKRAEQIANLQTKLGERALITPGWAIENTLPEAIVRTVLGRWESLTADQTSEIRRADYRDQRFDRYVDSLVNRVASRAPRRAYTKGRHKQRFCNDAVPLLEEAGVFSVLDDDVRALVESIYRHISEQNT